MPLETVVEPRAIAGLFLKLRRDVVFLPTKDGVTFRNEKGLFSIKGAGSYSLLSKLFEFFDGTRSVADVCVHVPPDRRAAVEQLVSTLVDRGVLRTHVPEASDLLSAAVQRRFARQLEFIEHQADRPLERFRRFRDSRVLVVGDGPAASKLLASLVRNGLKRVDAVLRSGEEPGADVESTVGELERAGVDASVVQRPAGDVEIDGFDAVACCSSQPSLSEILALFKACRERRVTFLPGIVVGAHSYVGPLVSGGRTPCWCCSVLRIASNAEPGLAAAMWRSLGIGTRLSDGRTAPASPACRMLGNNIAFELFKDRCGHLEPETKSRVLVQSLETLETSSVPAVPHPLCPVCAAHDAEEGGDALVEIRDTPALSAQTALTRLHALIHPQMGLVQGFRDEDLTQLPLRVSIVAAAHPSGTREAIAIPAFHQESTLGARRVAIERALRDYASSARALTPATRATGLTLGAGGGDPVAHEDLITWAGGPAAGPDDTSDWIRAYAPRQDRFRYVPAAAVLPLSAFNASGSFPRAPVGLACGTSFGEVVKAGLLNALAYERLRRHVREAGDVVRLREDDIAALDPELEHLVQSIRRFEQRLCLLELAGPGAARVVLAGLGAFGDADPSAFALGAGASLEDAAFQALMPLVGSLQLASTPAALGYSAGQLLPGFAFHHAARVVESTGVGPSGARAAADEALDFSLAGDHDVLVADLTPRDLRELKTFYVGTVLLARSKGGARGDRPAA